MITLQTAKSSIDNIFTELDLKVGGIEELESPQVLNAMVNAVFTISAQAFLKAMNIEAKANPKKYHHIYEWNKVGLSTGRLFLLYKQSSGSNMLRIKPVFKQSTAPVPIDPDLLIPGRTGKSVVKRTVFRDKATVMEAGTPIRYVAPRPLPIMEDGRLRFIAAGTYINNYYPGGKEVKGSFERFFRLWFDTKVSAIIDASGMLDNIDSTVAKVLNQKGAGSEEVKTAIISLLQQYSKGKEIV